MKTITKTNLIKRILVSCLIIFLMFFGFVLGGCKLSNPESTSENISEGHSGFFTTPVSVMEMLHDSHDKVYQLLNSKLTFRSDENPKNIWWTLDYETPHKITKLYARCLVESNDVNGTIYDFCFNGELTPDDILNETEIFKNAEFKKVSTFMYSQQDEILNQSIADAMLEKYSEEIRVKSEDVLFGLARIKRPVEPSKTRNLSVVYYTKLETVKIEFTLPTQVSAQGYATEIYNSNQSGITSIKHYLYGKIFFDDKNIK